MEPTHQPTSAKKNTTVTINVELLRIARELGVNLSRTLEERLFEIVAARRREVWLAENQSAMVAYNERIERHGTFSEEARRF